ncbi:hypothetical protein MNBD_GAMMA12-1241, partial [hydrothermal vent metagenome]
DKKIMFEPNPNTANGLPIWEVKLVNGKEVKQSTFGKLEIGGKILYIKSAEGYPSLMLKNNPRIPTNARSYTHVEGRAASIMRQSGIKSAKLTINNTNGVCDPCRGNMEKSLLPDGGKLNVRYPDGQGGYTQRILIKR